MTHVPIMTLSLIVSEIQTDGQAKCIYIYGATVLRCYGAMVLRDHRSEVYGRRVYLVKINHKDFVVAKENNL